MVRGHWSRPDVAISPRAIEPRALPFTPQRGVAATTVTAVNLEDVRNLGAALAPWLAALGGIAAIASSVFRTRSTDRLRSSLERDSAVHRTLEAGPAKTEVAELVLIDAQRLRSRVEHGRQFSVSQMFVLLGLFSLTVGAFALLVNASGERGLIDNSTGTRIAYSALSSVALVTGTLFLGGGLVASILGWFNRKADQAILLSRRPDPGSFLGAMITLRKAMRIRRARRAAGAEFETSEPEQDASPRQTADLTADASSAPSGPLTPQR